MHCKYHSRVMVQVVSATLLQPLDPGVPSGSGATEEAIGLELLLFNFNDTSRQAGKGKDRIDLA